MHDQAKISEVEGEQKKRAIGLNRITGSSEFILENLYEIYIKKSTMHVDASI